MTIFYNYNEHQKQTTINNDMDILDYCDHLQHQVLYVSEHHHSFKV